MMSPWPGVRIIGTPHDRGDGSYEVDVVWDPEITAQPGVIVQQPDRPPIVVSPAPGDGECPPRDCREAAGDLLDCLGLEGVDAKSVRVTRVCLEVDVQAPPCKPDCGDDKARQAGKPRRKGPCC